MNVITIDGPSGTGKGTVAGLLAEYLGWKHVDSGKLFRALALKALEQRFDLANPQQCTALANSASLVILEPGGVMLDGRNLTNSLHDLKIDAATTTISGHPGVREVVKKLQLQYAEAWDCVVDGRAGGTEVFPKAQLKIFMNASQEERVRRYLSRPACSEEYDSVAEAIAKRDGQDATRSLAPMGPAHNAWILDVTSMDPAETLHRILARIRTVAPHLLATSH